MRPGLWFAVALLALSVGGFATQSRQRGGQAGVFRTDTPEIPLDVIAGAPTKDAVLLSVRAAKDGKYRIDYTGKGDKGTLEGDLRAGEPREVEVKGLKPDTAYSYTAMVGDARVTGKFRTARGKDSEFVFDVQADSHLDENTSLDVYANTLKNEVADQADFLVDLGDTFMVDKYQQYTDSLKQYQAQRYWFSVVGSQMPVFLCLGNHDGECGWAQRGGDVASWSREQRRRYLPVIRPDGFYSGAPDKGLYYSWTWGDALFVVLDPFVATMQRPHAEGDGWNWTLGKAQFGWLESTLKQSDARFKFIFIHHLVGGFGREARGGVEAAGNFEWGDEAEFPSRRTGWAEPVHALMKKYHVSALFHGHDHLYVRQERDGILYIEVPQPSAVRENTRSAEEYGYKSGKLLASPGHIRVTVRPTGAKLEYVKSRLSGANREVVDSVEVSPRK